MSANPVPPTELWGIWHPQSKTWEGSEDDEEITEVFLSRSKAVESLKVYQDHIPRFKDSVVARIGVAPPPAKTVRWVESKMTRGNWSLEGMPLPGAVSEIGPNRSHYGIGDEDDLYRVDGWAPTLAEAKEECERIAAKLGYEIERD